MIPWRSVFAALVPVGSLGCRPAPVVRVVPPAVAHDAGPSVALPAPADEALRGWRPTVTADMPELPSRAAREPVVPTGRCLAVDARNRQRLAPGNRAAAAHHRAHPAASERIELRIDPTRTYCALAPTGFWSLTLAPSRFTASDDSFVSAVTALSWTPTQGPSLAWSARFTSAIHEMSSTYPTIDRVFDWDGDGAPEVVVRVDTWEHEASPEDPVTVYTVRDGAVRLYPSAQPFAHIDDVEDVDGDGRPDLVLPSPWRFVDRCGLDGIAHTGPSLLAHSVQNGTFLLDDAAARAWVRRQCLSSARARSEATPDVFDVACARVLGQRPEAIVRAVRALAQAFRGVDPEQAATNEQCMTLDELAATADVSPPVELSGAP